MSRPIFVSYSHDDTDYVRRLVQHLTTSNIPVWLDEALSTGQPEWVRRIERVIEDCAGLLLVMSPASAASPWVDRETDLAQELGKPIFPLLLAGRRHLRVRDVQTEDVTGGRMPSARLLDVLYSLTRLQPGPRPSAEDPRRNGAAVPSAEAHLRGLQGSMSFDGAWITIRKNGFGPAMAGERRVHIRQIAGVNFKAATAMFHGFIQVVVMGETPAKAARVGLTAGRPPMDDPLSTSFSTSHNAEAARLRSTIEQAMGLEASPGTGSI